jgi:hypothetical protein
MHPLIQEKRADIAALCRRYRVRHLEVFGSAARGDDFDLASSDADFLVELNPKAICRHSKNSSGFKPTSPGCSNARWTWLRRGPSATRMCSPISTARGRSFMQHDSRA